MELPERVRMLRNVAIKIASPIIKVSKDKQIQNLTEKKQIALECQALGINQVKSFSKEMKEVWINNCYNALRMMYDDEVDSLAKVALFFGETYQMKFFAQDIKQGNYKNKEALELIFNNMSGSMGDLIIK
jgi:hypothetical protein